jgi:Zn-dependent protease with chaperone function
MEQLLRPRPLIRAGHIRHTSHTGRCALRLSPVTERGFRGSEPVGVPDEPGNERDIDLESIEAALPLLAAAQCPRCAAPVPDGGSWVTWCEACEWNLQVAMPAKPRGMLARREHWLVSRAAVRTYDELVVSSNERPRATASKLTLLTLMVLVILCVPLLGLGVGWLAIAGSGFWRWPAVLLGGLLFWLLLPRPVKMPKDVVLLARTEAPELWRLVDAVAAGLETEPPALLGVNTDYNAYVSQVGWRRRRLLVIGLSLWSAEEPQERVATLGHELGHLRHRDTGRGLVIWSGMRVLYQTIDVLLPDIMDSHDATYSELALLNAVSTGLRRLLALPLIGLLMLAVRLDAHESQREEYLADLASVRLAGREAAAMSLHRLLAITGVETRLGAAVRRGEDPWSALDATVAPPERELRRLLLASERRGHSVDSSHPPTHLRVSLVRSRPDTDGEIELDPAWMTCIDAELAPVRARLARQLRDDMLDR